MLKAKDWALGAFLLGALLRPTASPGAEEGAPAAGALRLPSGLTVKYTYSYNKNALDDSRHSVDALIALTGSGNLLRFDPRTLRPNREWFGPSPVVCLGEDGRGTVFAGFADGRIGVVDRENLVPTVVARLPREPYWIGASQADRGPGRLIVVTGPPQWDGPEVRQGPFLVHDLAEGRSYTFDPPKIAGYRIYPSAFLIDGRKRLWIGGDGGEFGGWCSYLDLTAGQIHHLADPDNPLPDEKPPDPLTPEKSRSWDPVLGFVGLRDGQVWVYGGMSAPWVRRIDSGEAVTLFREAEREEFGAREDLIDRIVEDAPAHEVIVLRNELYAATTELTRWHRLGRVDWGPVCAIHLPGEVDGLVFACEDRGYLRLDAGKTTDYSLPNQPPPDEIGRIVATNEGNLFLGRVDSGPAYSTRAGRWEDVDLTPLSRGERYRVVVGPDGTALSVVHDHRGAVTARRRGGRMQIIAEEDESTSAQLFDLGATFSTPDGGLWAVEEHARGWLRRQVAGRWNRVARLPAPPPRVKRATRRGRGPRVIPTVPFIGQDMSALRSDGPPWILLDRERRQLLRLSYGHHFTLPRLELLRLREWGEAVRVHDAIPDGPAGLLLATNRGMRSFDTRRAQLGSTSYPTITRQVTLIARDRRGRIWLAGDGLWLIDADGRTLHDLGALPMLGDTEPVALAPDDAHDDGVAASLGPRGLLFVRVTAP